MYFNTPTKTLSAFWLQFYQLELQSVSQFNIVWNYAHQCKLLAKLNVQKHSGNRFCFQLALIIAVTSKCQTTQISYN